MKLSKYLKDKKIIVISTVIFLIFSTMLMKAFKVDNPCIITIIILVVLFVTINLLYDYSRRSRFYNDFLAQLENLDKKIFIIETMEDADFLEAQIMSEALYEINLEIHNDINTLKRSVSNFKEYVEMWIHEVKLPLASLLLMNHNKNMDVALQKQKLDELEQYLQQILFYIRADVADKDYLLKRVVLNDVVNNVLKNNKEVLIFNHIVIDKAELKENLNTDEKWLEFIIGQIISNCVKYRKDNPVIKFYTESNNEQVKLIIEDNGIGICESDVSRVFEKSFTGENGRIGRNSTGMGLYICKKLCDKLGHTIEIQSEKNKFTRVIITFGRNEFYTDVI